MLWRRLTRYNLVNPKIDKISEPDVWKRMETADLIYTGQTATASERWSNTNDNSDTDSVAELEYKTWDDACA